MLGNGGIVCELGSCNALADVGSAEVSAESVCCEVADSIAAGFEVLSAVGAADVPEVVGSCTPGLCWVVV